MKQWIFTFEELLDFTKQNFNDYTLFLKSKLGKRHDNTYICGTWCIISKEIDLIDTKNSVYNDSLYLITGIDIDNKYIEFNQIGKKEEIKKKVD